MKLMLLWIRRFRSPSSGRCQRHGLKALFADALGKAKSIYRFLDDRFACPISQALCRCRYLPLLKPCH